MTISSSRRRLILGTGTAAGVIIALAIVVAIQFIALRNAKRWDLTKAGIHTLSSQSVQVLDTYKQRNMPIDVLAFYETKDVGPRDDLKDLLDRYRDVDSNFKYSFVDPDKDRSIALKHKIDSYPTVIITAGKKEERITAATEETFTNALVKLLRDEVKKIYFLKGHGELSLESTESDGLSTAKEQIEKQNYKVEDLVLLQAPEVPQDATILVIAGPRTDPMDNELASIKQYIDRGGSLMVLLHPFKSPKLCGLLKDYGFVFADDIVVDRMSRALGGDYLMPVITTYIQFPITKNFTLASFFPEVRSVRVAEKRPRNIDAKDLALTSPVSWTIDEQQLNSGNANFDEKTGMKGPISVMAVSVVSIEQPAEKTPGVETSGGGKSGAEAGSSGKKTADENRSSAKAPTKARIVVFGSSQLAANKFYKLQGNPDLFMNTVSWLAEDENLISIRPKSLHAQPLILTIKESWALLLIPVVLLPLSCIIAGLVVYLYRRRIVAA